jgi:glucose-1-phosphate cytidylyltransferase
MKVVILAGGHGTRISEETATRPKPMIEIGGRPILWHIMKLYAGHGLKDFVVCLGYKGHIIKEYFSNYFLHSADVTFDFACDKVEYHGARAEPWRVTLVDTGAESMTGGRLKRVMPFLSNEESFCFTYGDGLADVDIRALVARHRQSGRLATVTAVMPPGRFGAIRHDDGLVTSFEEKPEGDGAWINGGFMVLSPRVDKYILDDASIWEREPMERLAADRQLAAYFHSGFWQPMDTLRDKQLLEKLWASGAAPWKSWRE